MNAQSDDTLFTYCITVQGRLDTSWSAWLCGMSISVENAGEAEPVTTLTGPVVDQTALRGILNKLWDLNLTLVSVDRASQ